MANHKLQKVSAIRFYKTMIHYFFLPARLSERRIIAMNSE